MSLKAEAVASGSFVTFMKDNNLSCHTFQVWECWQKRNQQFIVCNQVTHSFLLLLVRLVHTQKFCVHSFLLLPVRLKHNFRVHSVNVLDKENGRSRSLLRRHQCHQATPKIATAAIMPCPLFHRLMKVVGSISTLLLRNVL